MIKRLIIWLVPIFWIVGQELLLQFPAWWIFILPICFFVIILAVLFLTKSRFDKLFGHFLLLPFLFAFSCQSLIMFLADGVMARILIYGAAIILYFILSQYYLFIYVPSRYQPYSLESLTLYISLISVFCFCAGVFAALTLINLSWLWVLPILIIYLIALTYQFFWLNKFDWHRSCLFVFVITGLLIELIVVLAYLPTGYYVNAAVLTVIYYLFLGLSKNYLNETLSRQRRLFFLVVGLVSVVLILASAQWQ